ncbi:MAG: hypothetical protein KDA60_20115 [Planctomycetales bacterium]|nr:hypothetical protein [Planctomycetales bacterium]
MTANSWTVQPLDSFRLGNYQFPLPCYLCEENNLFDAAMCRRCHAPLALTRSSMQKKGARPNLVLTLGADDVGKSIYLGTLLDILSRERDRSDVTSHGPSSVSLQHRAMSALAKGEFPDQTSPNPEDWYWAQCRLQRRSRKEPFTVFFPDMSGNAIFAEIDRPNSHRSVTGGCARATGVYLFVDSARIEKGDKDEEFLALKILSYLGEVLEREAEESAATAGRRGRAHKAPPLAIVLAKADQCESCWEDPAGFVAGNLPGLWQHCCDNFPVHDAFAVSVVGACARNFYDAGRFEQIPLRVEPRGIMEPFRWMMRNIMT